MDWMKRVLWIVGTTLVMSLPGGMSFAETNGTLAFTDIASGQGIDLTAKLTESVAWGDYDNDGDEDLYLTSNGANNLFRNDGGGVFVDVTGTAGVGSNLFSVGTAFADLDNDGDLDLYVVTFGAGDDVLYRNNGPVGLGGEYTFSNVTSSAGLTSTDSSRGIAFIDYDRDGLLDIYVNAIGNDILYRNFGGLTFVDFGLALGIDNPGQGVGVVATDLDRNGWVDLYTGNRSSDPNRAYLNYQAALTDVTANGIGGLGLGMGVLSFDYDNDLDFDLYWTTWPGGGASPVPNELYRNIDGSHFVDVAAASQTQDDLGWGISCNSGDIDNDGWEDFYVTNGFDATTTANVLFQNDRDGTFTDVTSAVGGGAFDGRGVAFADFDDDGDLDVCVTADALEPTQLWRNDSVTGNHWITLKLQGTCSNRSAVGARIELFADTGTGTTAQVKEVSGGAGRGSFNSLPVEFGLGTATSIDEIRVHWPSGIFQQLYDVAVDDALEITEPCNGLTLWVGRDDLFWTRSNQGLPVTFDVVRGDLGTLLSTGGDFTTATIDCLTAADSKNFMLYAAEPGAGDGFWFLARDSGGGTYDEPSGSQVGSRDAGIDAAAGGCP